jgi:plastocyanin
MEHMRKLIIGIAATLALAVVAPATAATTRTVNIYGSGFSPKSVTITEGDTVTWVNRDNANHQVLESSGRFVSAILRPRQTYSFTFNAAGTYRYKDELHPRLTGTIIVKGAPPTLTMTSNASILTYGQEGTLSGVVSSKKEGETVTIWYQPYPQPNLIKRADLLTGAGGTFSFIIAPRILTTYQASWRGAYSLPVTVQLAPKISLGRNNGWLIHVAGGRSFAGRAVQLQRLNTLTGQWVTLRKPLLNSASKAKVQVTLPKGTNRLRVAMSVNQAGAGYLGAFSPVVVWRVT